MKRIGWCLIVAGLCVVGAEARLKALIIDGQNNHTVWPKSTVMMKQYLEESGLFEVEVDRVRFIWKSEREADFLPLAGDFETEAVKSPKPDPDFSPAFSDYDVIISNFGWKAADLTEETQQALETYMRNGGGFVSVHAADNAWPMWLEYNKMIGLGGWGGRTEKDGPMVYFDENGKERRDDTPGKAGTHGKRHEFPVIVRSPNHPIMKGLPKVWLTSEDECYAKLRGPAEQMTVLATGEDQTVKERLGQHQPVLMAVEYGKGRCFHTTLGHDAPAFEGVGFITTFLRGCEWAASGKVTLPVPDDFPTADSAASRPFRVKQ
ncbi:ThuA domain-containing protein [Pontiella sp.]|uniref:ThuA domain-containing protein n=1 Tax=Pontiella sp. TaxID=2837462 RepID=UPI00356ACCE2